MIGGRNLGRTVCLLREKPLVVSDKSSRSSSLSIRKLLGEKGFEKSSDTPAVDINLILDLCYDRFTERLRLPETLEWKESLTFKLRMLYSGTLFS